MQEEIPVAHLVRIDTTHEVEPSHAFLHALVNLGLWHTLELEIAVDH